MLAAELSTVDTARYSHEEARQHLRTEHVAWGGQGGAWQVMDEGVARLEARHSTVPVRGHRQRRESQEGRT